MEHWLNGTRVVRFEIAAPEVRKHLQELRKDDGEILLEGRSACRITHRRRGSDLKSASTVNSAAGMITALSLHDQETQEWGIPALSEVDPKTGKRKKSRHV